MLTYLKNLVKNHQSDIYITLIIILLALIGFGAGYLLAPKNNNPIIINNPTSTSIEETLENKEEELKKGMFVGSINSDKYHWPDCPSAKKISPENQIWFSSEEEAQEAGYIRCGNFEKYSP